jgi:hypothetical protein
LEGKCTSLPFARQGQLWVRNPCNPFLPQAPAQSPSGSTAPHMSSLALISKIREGALGRGLVVPAWCIAPRESEGCLSHRVLGHEGRRHPGRTWKGVPTIVMRLVCLPRERDAALCLIAPWLDRGRELPGLDVPQPTTCTSCKMHSDAVQFVSLPISRPILSFRSLQSKHSSVVPRTLAAGAQDDGSAGGDAARPSHQRSWCRLCTPLDSAERRWTVVLLLLSFKASQC